MDADESRSPAPQAGRPRGRHSRAAGDSDVDRLLASLAESATWRATISALAATADAQDIAALLARAADEDHLTGNGHAVAGSVPPGSPAVTVLDRGTGFAFDLSGLMPRRFTRGRATVNLVQAEGGDGGSDGEGGEGGQGAGGEGAGGDGAGSVVGAIVIGDLRAGGVRILDAEALFRRARRAVFDTCYRDDRPGTVPDAVRAPITLRHAVFVDPALGFGVCVHADPADGVPRSSLLIELGDEGPRLWRP